MPSGKKWKETIHPEDVLKIKAYYKLGESVSSLRRTYGLNYATIKKVIEDTTVYTEEEVLAKIDELKKELWNNVRLDYESIQKCREDTILIAENRLNKLIRQDNDISATVLSKIALDTQRRFKIGEIKPDYVYDQHSDEELAQLEEIATKQLIENTEGNREKEEVKQN